MCYEYALGYEMDSEMRNDYLQHVPPIVMPARLNLGQLMMFSIVRHVLATTWPTRMCAQVIL